MRRSARFAATLLCGAPAAILAQGSVATLALQGAGSQTGTGAFRCAPGEKGEMSLSGTDSSHDVVPLEPYAPEAISSDERVIAVKVPDYSAYVVEVVCVGDGDAWITVKAGDAEVHMAALVGMARRKATPKWTPGAPTTPRAITSTIAPAGTTVGATPNGTTTAATPLAAGPHPQISVNAPGPAKESATRVAKHDAIPDAPAVPATALSLSAGYDRSVILRWRPAPGAAGYRIARKDVAANTLATITGETVEPDGRGLLTDTAYVDRGLEVGKTYAYYLATYFRRADGSYYYPDRASEQHGLATPRDRGTVGWLPADWKNPVSLVSSTIENGMLTVVWRSKFAAQRYAFGSVIVTNPGSAGSCESADEMFFDLAITDTAYTKNIADRNASGARANTYCFSIRAKFPDETGSVRLGGYLLYVPVGRDCPSDARQPCGPWRALSVESIRRNQPGGLVRLVDEEP